MMILMKTMSQPLHPAVSVPVELQDNYNVSVESKQTHALLELLQARSAEMA